jgi:dihydroorotate dehydrogenase electron transfer subunit
MAFIEEKKADADILYAAGPKAMLKAACAYARANNIQAQGSLEERMACGIGACFCCSAKVKSEGGYEYEKVCKHGPVFAATEVMWDE